MLGAGQTLARSRGRRLGRNPGPQAATAARRAGHDRQA